MKILQPVLETVREAIDHVKTGLINTVAAYNLAMKDPEGLQCTMHHTSGRWIRNNWGLWGESKLKEELEGLGIDHPDDMSSYIIKTAIDELRAAEFKAWAQREIKDGKKEV